MNIYKHSSLFFLTNPNLNKCVSLAKNHWQISADLDSISAWKSRWESSKAARVASLLSKFAEAKQDIHSKSTAIGFILGAIFFAETVLRCYANYYFCSGTFFAPIPLFSDGVARNFLWLQFYLPPYAAESWEREKDGKCLSRRKNISRSWFEPASVELHQTGTYCKLLRGYLQNQMRHNETQPLHSKTVHFIDHTHTR